MESRMWAPPEAASLDVKRSADLGVPIGFEIDAHTVRRAEMYRQIHEWIDAMPVLEVAPVSPSLWMTPIQRADNDHVRLSYGGHSPLQELTASFSTGSERVLVPLRVGLNDEVTSLLIEPLGLSPSEAFYNACGTHHLMVSMAADLGLPKVTYFLRDEEHSFHELAALAVLEGPLNYPDSVAESRAIRLQPAISDDFDSSVVACVAVNDASQDRLLVVLPADVAASTTSYQRATIAASIASDANRQMKFRRPIEVVGLTYRPPDSFAPASLFAVVLDAKIRPHRPARMLLVNEGFVHDETGAITGEVFQQYVRNGFFLSAKDEMFVAASHAVIDASLEDAGHRTQIRRSAMYGAASAAFIAGAITEFVYTPVALIGAGYALANLGLTLRTGLMDLGVQSTMSQINRVTPDVANNIRRLGISSVASFNIVHGEDVSSACRKILTAAFLRDDFAQAFAAQLSTVMRPFNADVTRGEPK